MVNVKIVKTYQISGIKFLGAVGGVVGGPGTLRGC
jgi:hypothetical protein